MDHDKNKPVCDVCGGSNFVKDKGFFYCEECQTQSQDLREEVFEDHEGILATSQVTTIKKAIKKKTKLIESGSHKDQNEDFTTWESYNFILKGQVEELISLGVHPSFRHIVIQLWVAYLSKLEVAFTSKKHKSLPRLGPSFHMKNIRLVYGVDNLPKKRRKSRTSAMKSMSECSGLDTTDYSDSEINLKRKFKKTKKALMSVESEKYITETESATEHSSILNSSSDVDWMNTSDTMSTSSKYKIRYSRAALKIRKSNCSKYNITSLAKREIMSKTNFRYVNPNILTKRKLLALLYIGLLYLEDTIQLSDMMRWLREGHISYHEVSQFFPKSYKLQGEDNSIFSAGVQLPSYNHFQRLTTQMKAFLGITQLPKPNMLTLITRYVKELQLPAMLTTIAERLMVTAPLSIEWKSQYEVPNYEGRAMAIIIVILKLLFGIDDQTEHCISSTVSSINKLVNANRRGSKEQALPTVFVWDDWMSYIICRKAILIRYHIPTKHSIFPESANNPELFIDFMTMWTSKYESKETRVIPYKEQINKPELVHSLKRPFERLAEIDPVEDTKIDFPPSLTPLTTYTDCIKTFHSDEHNNGLQTQDSAFEILDNDFTATDLMFFLQPEPYISFAEAKGCKITVKMKSAHKHFQTLEEFTYINNDPYSIKRWRKDLAIHIFNAGETQKCGFNLRKKKQNMKEQHRSASGKKRKDEMCVKNGSRLNDGTPDYRPSVESGLNNQTSGQSTKRTHPSAWGQASIPLKRPKEAEILLKRFLKENGIQETKQSCGSFTGKKKKKKKKASSQRSNQKVRKHCRESKCSLYVPGHKYWMFEGKMHSRFPEEKFESEVVSKFPVNFHWLLTECAHMLEMSKKDLYREVLSVERGCVHVLN